MWTTENRGRYERKGQRYPSDLTDEEWALVETHLPRERRRDRREILNAILYVLSTGCQWRALPKDFPPKSTVHDYFVEWHCDGTLTRIHTPSTPKSASWPARSRWQPPQSSIAKASRARKRGA